MQMYPTLKGLHIVFPPLRPRPRQSATNPQPWLSAKRILDTTTTQYNAPMLRRWLIRVSCLLALAFVVGMWLTSHIGAFDLAKSFGGRVWEIGAARGLTFIYEDAAWPYPDEPLNAIFVRGESIEFYHPIKTTLGFYAGPAIVSNSFMVVFPLWLPTLFLTAVTWFVWRKTRHQRSFHGFPVEPTTTTPAPSPPPAQPPHPPPPSRPSPPAAPAKSHSAPS
jgi:hypothetical protein